MADGQGKLVNVRPEPRNPEKTRESRSDNLDSLCNQMGGTQLHALTVSTSLTRGLNEAGLYPVSRPEQAPEPEEISQSMASIIVASSMPLGNKWALVTHYGRKFRMMNRLICIWKLLDNDFHNRLASTTLLTDAFVESESEIRKAKIAGNLIRCLELRGTKETVRQCEGAFAMLNQPGTDITLSTDMQGRLSVRLAFQGIGIPHAAQ